MKNTSLFILFFISFQLVVSQESTGTIKTETVKKHLYTLASDAMEGRKTGTPGIEKQLNILNQNSRE